ncbi:FERM and PDZ domain-containing protein 1 isoform X2 [Corvus kubaryi]|uniref:FERM and PDZ domain-containing protein 1 isoform X2 n=1 Tax=Corvus kubaryi TaxID=68294 RepID=UPI001C056967|nr:FERM and PDZ domain-containing protein 1 isoform X2 [Corvus kubaryi]XP_041879031.1 FERM and PDZ domain-containing protein 1 isoform X2 [Corvus kubaryi]XP_041879032.1 FERM and PDZ domain-containing protein 1 isoform X2 [Corvus kubaryi]
MGDLETSLIHTRKTCRIEQMVAKWLHRSRDSAPRENVPVMDSTGDSAAQPPSRVKVTVTVYKDLVLQHYGFEICPSLPLTIASVTAGSTAEGKLQPGDQLLMINSTAVDDVSVERAASIIREAGDELLLTVLRCASGGPKSSFLTAEKRARLKTNPVKVRFAEEVLLNGHSQCLPDPPVLLGTERCSQATCSRCTAHSVTGSSLLFMPNVLKVYLENGQTKAFRFERSTTVKDIVLTLQEKLSIRSIAHFALVLEEQYSLAKIHLLHEEELIAQVVQKRDSHDYRCLFRVCFVPKDPLDLLQEDPVAFEYLYLQSCSDVLQERFAVEMKCSVALRLAALHIQERICACAQPQKVSLKYIERDWGIENFISPTLLRNMRGKDIKKAISYHLKRNQVLLDPRQKHTLTAAQVRLSYLQILGELKMYSGKIFNATLMQQDRESYVALLVGAKHGVSQIINSKLNIITSLAEFPSISRVELSEESERVSTVKIYLQDLKLLTLLLESNSAKDLVCLIVGYYRLFVDANVSIFTWGEKKQQLHRVSAEEGYESRACSDSEDSWDPDSSSECRTDTAVACGSEEGRGEPRSPGGSSAEPQAGGGDPRAGGDNATDSTSEASDSANTESRGVKTSGSSDSVDALEEDELEACSSSRPELFHFYAPTVQEMSSADRSFVPVRAAGSADFFCFLQVPGDSPSEPGAAGLSEADPGGCCSPGYSASPAGSAQGGGAGPGHAGPGDLVLKPPPGFGDSSSEEEFYDAADRLSPPDALAGYDMASWEGTESSSCIPKRLRCYSLRETPSRREKHGQEKELTYTKNLRKRRSFLKTDYTSQVSFPAALPGSPQRCCSWPPTQPSTEDTGKDMDMGLPLATQAQRDPAGSDPCSDLMDMEPDTTETKSVREWVVSSVSDIHHPGDQRGEVDLQPAHPPLLSLEEAEPLPRGQSGAAQESSPKEADPGCLTEESCVPTGGWQTKGAQEGGRGVVATQHKVSVVPSSWDPKGTCPPDKLLLLPPAPGPSMAPPWELAQDQGPLPASVEPSPAPCQESQANGQSCITGKGSADGDHCADGQHCAESEGRADGQHSADGQCCADGQCHANSSSDGAVSWARSPQVVSGETLWKVHEGHVGFPEAAQLLADGSSASGPSWLSFGVRTDPVSPSSLQDRVDDPCEPLACLRTSGCMGASAVGRKMPTAPAGAGCSRELVSSSGLGEGQPMRDADMTQPEPRWASLPREQAAGLGKDSCLAPSAALSLSSVPVPLGKGAGAHGAAKHSFLCLNPEDGEQTPSPRIPAGPLGCSLAPRGLESCGCRLPYISCFPQPHNQGERDTSPPQFPGPLTTPPSGSCSLPRTPGSSFPVSIAGDGAGQDPPIRVLGQLKDQAWMSPVDFSRFLAYTAELQEVVGKLCGNQATHLHDQCAEQGAESKGALGWASQDLLSSCQALLSTDQPLTEMQRALRATFDRLVHLAVTCFQVTHCRRCRQRQQELGAALGDVVGTYQQLVQALHQQLHRQVCPELGTKLLARQHTALAAAVFCLLQQFRASPWM